MSKPRLFVFGLGYSGAALARAAKDRCEWVGGTTRSADSAAAMKSEGIAAFVFDGTAKGKGVAAALKDATHAVMCVPPGTEDPVLAHHADDLGAASLQWLGYLSTVGVYGDSGGAWVDEDTPPAPVSERSRQRLVAEQAWRAFADKRGVPLAILRVAGIYGPARNAFVALSQGTAHRIVKPGQVFNRIHLDDLTAALVAALEGAMGGIFNVADDEPAPPQDVVAFAARLMGIAPPREVPFENASLSPMARSFYEECKRVRNERLVAALGIALKCPTYREGLKLLWADGRWRQPSH